MNKLMRNKELRLLLTQNCNYDCVFCSHEGLNSKPKQKLGIDDYTYLYTVCRDNFDWRNITLTGGEPLLYKDFDELVTRIAKQQGRITVVSNGYLLHKHTDTVDLLKRINLSLHSLDEEKYNAIIQNKNKLPRVISNIINTRANSPHVDVRLNVVLTKDFNDSQEEIKRLLDFIDLTGCSLKFIELANDKDKVIPLDEIKQKLNILGVKERTHDNRSIVMSDNVFLTRTSCETAQIAKDPESTCREAMDFFIAPNGIVNHCVVNNSEDSILHEIKIRDSEKLVGKLSKLSESFAANCVYAKSNHKDICKE